MALHGRRTEVAAARGLTVVVLGLMALLLLQQRYLPMNDAPSHLANAVILRGLGSSDGFFSAHYSVQALPLPYWTCALLLQPLLSLLPPWLAFQGAVLLYLILLPLSFALLAREVAPENRVLTPVAALMGMNWAYFLGEINFLWGQPLALLAFWSFLRLPRRGPAGFAGFALLLGATYLSHIYALSALCAMLGCQLLLALWRRQRLRPLQEAALLLSLALFLLGAYLVLCQHGTDANRGGLGFDLSARKAAHLLIDPLDSPRPPSRPVLLGLLGALGLLWLWPRPGGEALRARLRLPMLLPGLVLLAVAYAGPAYIRNPDGSIKEAEMAARLALLAVLLLLLAVRAPALPRRGQAALLGLLVLLAGFKLHDAYLVHRRFTAESAQVLGLIRRLPQGSRLLPLMDVPGATAHDYLLHRLGALVVVERHGYSPHVFAVLGQHPLRHRRWGDYRQVDDLQVRPEEWSYYDHILVQSGRPQPAVPGLTERARLLASAAGFHLYEIRR